MVPTIEILDINDKPAESEDPSAPVSPTEEQVVEEVQQFFKNDPLNQFLGITKLHAIVKEKHKNWTIGEKRFKQIMKTNNLNSQLKQEQYLDMIEYPTNSKSLPKKVFTKFNDLKGYSLNASCKFETNEVIFTELKPLFFVPQLDHFNLIRSSKACTYCGALLSKLNHSSKKKSFLDHLDCNHCSDLWCSSDCKKADRLHNLSRHTASKSNHLIKSKDFEKYVSFCFENGVLQDFYAIAIIHAYFQLDESLSEVYFNGFAKVSEEIRYSIKHPGASINDDEIYKKGFELLNEIFINDKIEWEKFLLMLGIYNLNNYECSIFQIQSLLNHDCEGNTRIEIIEDNKIHKGIKIIANKNIHENNELTFPYINPHFEFNNRLKDLRLNYGFVCHCSKCQKDNTDVQRRKSSNASHLNTLEEFKQMIKDNKINEFDLMQPIDEVNSCGIERRKSVRFNEKVIAVNEN